MTIRITSQFISNRFLGDLQQNLTQLDRVQTQITTGLRIQKPSDDPVGTTMHLTYQTTLDQLKQYQTNSETATAQLTQSLSVLSEVQNVIVKAKTEALAAANDVNTPSSHAAAASVITSLQAQLLGLANTQSESGYLFGGQKNSTPPFAANGTYLGDAQSVQGIVAPGQTIAVNVDGQTAFKQGIDVFQFLEDLRTALVNQDMTGVTQAIGVADDALKRNLEVQSSAGARIQQLKAQKNQMADTTLTFQDLKSKNSDTDITQAISEMQSRQVSYQASLASGAQLMKLSLLNYWNP